MRITIDHVEYEYAPGITVDFEFDGTYMSLTAYSYGQPVCRHVETCHHCHNFYVERVVARSVEEAIDKGWLVPL